MKKSVLIGISTILMASFLPAVSTFAATPATTQGTVSLKIDPNADHPGGDPDGDGNDTGDKGDFTLDHVVGYDFGEQSIDGKEMTLNATQTKPYVQVTDLRELSTGWTLTSNITDFKTEDGATLKGAELTLPAGKSVAVDSTNTSTAPTTSQVVLNGSDSALFSADVNAGIGSWMDQMYDTPTTLHIPAGATPGSYSATITWTLSDAPSGQA